MTAQFIFIWIAIVASVILSLIALKKCSAPKKCPFMDDILACSHPCDIETGIIISNENVPIVPKPTNDSGTVRERPGTSQIKSKIL